MRKVFLCLVVSLGSALALTRCTSNNGSPPAAEDSGLAIDASTPQTGSDGAVASDAGVDSSVPSTDAGKGDAAVDAPTDAPPEASVACGYYDAAVEFDASGEDGGLVQIVTEDGSVEEGGLPDPDTICSATGTPPGVTITFVNNAPCPVELWWVDFTCQEQLYAVIASNGGNVGQDTFEGHVWRLREPGTERVLLQYVVPLSTSPATVTYP
ncbi:MAG: hypothetical protein ACLQVI_11270 [Polyangiaceae bacterium]|jgi:hypothetical protein